MTKEEKRFEELYQESIKLYRGGRLDESLGILEQIDDEVSINKELIILDRAQLLSGLRRYEEAYKLLEEFILEKGLWIDDYIIEFKEFKAIRDNKRFLRLIEESKKNQQSNYHGKHEQFYFITPYKEGNKVIFMLHGNWFFARGERIHTVVPEFKKEMENLDGVTLCLLYSSKVGIHGYPYWYNYLNGAQEISILVDKLIQRNGMNRKDIIIAGFSAGGGVLFEAAINRKLSIKNIGLTMPHLPMLDDYTSRMDNLTDKYNFFIHTGDKDHLHEQALAFEKLLSRHYIEHKIYIEEGRGHTVLKGINKLFTHFLNYFK